MEIGRLVRADGVTDENNTLAEDRLRRAIANELMERGIESTDGRSQLIVRVSGRDIERNEKDRDKYVAKAIETPSRSSRSNRSTTDGELRSSEAV